MNAEIIEQETHNRMLRMGPRRTKQRSFDPQTDFQTRQADNVSDLQTRSACAPPLADKEIPHYLPDLFRSIEAGRPEGIIADRASGHRQNSPRGFQGNDFVVTVADLYRASRALGAGPHASGGALVGTDMAEPAMALVPQMIVGRAGATIVTGLTGSLAWGKETARTTFGWYSPGAAITQSDPTTNALNLTPHRMGGSVSYARQWAAQTGGRGERMLIQSLLAGAAAGVDAGALKGTGVAGQPNGLANASGVASITFGGAATLAKVADMIEQVETANATPENISFVASPAVKDKWSQLPKVASTAVMLWNTDTNRIEGKQAFVTSNLATTAIYAGDFSALVVAFWGSPDIPISILVDPFSESLNDNIRLVCETYADTGLLVPGVFCVPTDSAIQ